MVGEQSGEGFIVCVDVGWPTLNEVPEPLGSLIYHQRSLVKSTVLDYCIVEHMERKGNELPVTTVVLLDHSINTGARGVATNRGDRVWTREVEAGHVTESLLSS